MHVHIDGISTTARQKPILVKHLHILHVSRTRCLKARLKHNLAGGTVDPNSHFRDGVHTLTVMLRDKRYYLRPILVSASGACQRLPEQDCTNSSPLNVAN